MTKQRKVFADVFLALVIYTNEIETQRGINFNEIKEALKNLEPEKKTDEKSAHIGCSKLLDKLDDYQIIKGKFVLTEQGKWQRFYTTSPTVKLLLEKEYSKFISSLDVKTLTFLSENFGASEKVHFNVEKFFKDLPQIAEAEKYYLINSKENINYSLLNKDSTFDYELTHFGKNVIRRCAEKVKKNGENNQEKSR